MSLYILNIKVLSFPNVVDPAKSGVLIGNLNKIMFKQIRKAVSVIILVAFIFTSGQLSTYASTFATSVDPMPRMSQPGVRVHLSQEFTPAYLKGIVIHPENALKFDFIIYKGDKALSDAQKRVEYTKLTKYFLASLAIPDDDQWVNLSPYEKDRIIKDDFGKTEMGRDLLAQDYMLKQITASLIYPQDKLGQKFWDKVYAQAQQQYGTSNIPVNTFNKVWILPDDALIYEKGNTAYVLKNHLRVMLEEDYLALEKHSGISAKPINTINSKIVREIILPELQREVNEGENFAALRQVYSGMLLATWYKRVLKESLLSKIYANKSKVRGVDQDPRNNEEIYQQYLKAYKKGVFNFIKEDVDKYTHEVIPRKYFSGGTGSYSTAEHTLKLGHPVVQETSSLNPAQEAQLQTDQGSLDLAMVTATEDSAPDPLAPVIRMGVENDFMVTLSDNKNHFGFRNINGQLTIESFNGKRVSIGNNLSLNLDQITIAQTGNDYFVISAGETVYKFELKEDAYELVKSDDMSPGEIWIKHFVIDYKAGRAFITTQEGYVVFTPDNNLKKAEAVLPGQPIEAVFKSVLPATPVASVAVEAPVPLAVEKQEGVVTALDATGLDLNRIKQVAARSARLPWTSQVRPTEAYRKITGLGTYGGTISGLSFSDVKAGRSGDTIVMVKGVSQSKIDHDKFTRDLMRMGFGEYSTRRRGIIAFGITPKEQGKADSSRTDFFVLDVFIQPPNKVAHNGQNNVMIQLSMTMNEAELEEIMSVLSSPASFLLWLKFSLNENIANVFRGMVDPAFDTSLEEAFRGFYGMVNVGTIKLQSEKSIGDFNKKVLDSLRRDQPDLAMQSPGQTPAQAQQKAVEKNLGGIDLNGAHLYLQIKRDGKGVPLPVNQQNLENIHIDGLIPVILEIKPALDTTLLSELQGSSAPS